MEKTFLNPATSKQWRIEIDGLAIRTCLNGGKVKEILCDSAFQVKSKAGQRHDEPDAERICLSESGCRCWAGAVPSVCRQRQQRLYALGLSPSHGTTSS